MPIFGRACAAVVIVVATIFRGLEYFLFLVTMQKELDIQCIWDAACDVFQKIWNKSHLFVWISVEEYLVL